MNFTFIKTETHGTSISDPLNLLNGYVLKDPNRFTCCREKV